MAHDQAALFQRVVVAATGTYGPYESHLVRDMSASCNSTAGHAVFIEGAIGDDWAALKQKFSATTLTLPPLGGVVGVAEITPKVRFNVASMTAATTLVLCLYGMGVQ